MNVDDMTQGKYLKAETFGNPRLLTIDSISLEKMNDGKDKWVMFFRECTEGLVLNQTNILTLAELFGSKETDDWERQKVVLFVTPVEFGNKRVPGLRVRLPKGQGRPTHPKDPAPAAYADERRRAGRQLESDIPGVFPTGRPSPPMTQGEADLDESQATADDDLPF